MTSRPAPSRGKKRLAGGRQFGAVRLQALHLAASTRRNGGAKARQVGAAGFTQLLGLSRSAHVGRRRRTAWRRRRRVLCPPRRTARGRRWRRVFGLWRWTAWRRRRWRIFSHRRRRRWRRGRSPKWLAVGTSRQQERGCSDKDKGPESSQVHRNPRRMNSALVLRMCKRVGQLLQITDENFKARIPGVPGGPKTTKLF